VRVLRLRRNFGQTAAFSAGFDHARGRVVVTSTATCRTTRRHPAPSGQARRGLRHGLRLAPRPEGPLHPRLPSGLANRMISWSTGVGLHDYGCSLKAMRAEVVKGLRLYGEMHRFIPAVASWMGVSLAEMPVNHGRAGTAPASTPGPDAARAARPVHGEVPAAYGTRPAHLFGLMGLGCGAVVLSSWLPDLREADPRRGHRRPPLLLLGALLLLTGILLINFGLVAELLVRTYHESQGKPIYVLKERQPAADDQREPVLPAR